MESAAPECVNRCVERPPEVLGAVTRSPRGCVKGIMAENIGKGDFIDLVAKELGASKADAQRAVTAVLETITANLKKGNKITLTGFGIFDVVQRKARQGHNPQTGEKIKIAARKVPTFKAGKALKDLFLKK